MSRKTSKDIEQDLKPVSFYRAGCDDKKVLAERLEAFIREWNAIAHPFNWSSKSVAKVMAKCELTQPDLAIAA